MPPKATQNKSAKAKSSPNKKKTPRALLKIEQPKKLFSQNALKRLVNIAGAARITAGAVNVCKEFAEVMIYELAKLSACSARFNNRRSLQKGDIEFACAVIGTPILAPTKDFQKLAVKTKAVRLDEEGKVKSARTNKDGAVIKTKSATNAKRKIAFYQKNHSGKVVFSFAPFRKQISYVFQENFSDFGFESMSADGKVFRVKLSKEYKILFQYAIETVLARILADTFNICAIAKKKTIDEVILRQAALNHFNGLLV